MTENIKKLSSDEVAFFELDLFSAQRKNNFIFTPLYIFLVILIAKDKVLLLLQLAPIISISLILGFYNIKFLYDFYSKNTEKFADLIKDVLDFSKQTRGLVGRAKVVFSFRGQARTYKLLSRRGKAWSGTKWRARLYMLLYLMSIFILTFFIAKGYILDPLKPHWLVFYPLFLFLIANNVFWFAGYIYWLKKLKRNNI